jgi:hypothetical protein
MRLQQIKKNGIVDPVLFIHRAISPGDGKSLAEE